MSDIFKSLTVKNRYMHTVIIIGGGPAGCEAAYQLASDGIQVHLIEKNNETGGNLNNWYQLFPDRKNAQDLNKRLQEQLNHPGITLHLGMEPSRVEKDGQGRFSVSLSDGSLLEGDALLVATGFKTFDAKRKEEYGYGIYENVVTSVDLENMFRNHAIRTSKGDVPRRIGIIHCVGSRDEKVCNFHCSKLCCITGVKQAIELREMLPESEIFCFYMDMRMFGPGYEEMYREAQEKYNIKFIRGRLSEAAENREHQVQVKVEDTLLGRPLRVTLDLMVLLVGMEASNETQGMARELGVKLAPSGFILPLDPHYGNNLTGEKGVFITGCCSAPMNLTDTLNDARSAAVCITRYLNMK